MTSYGIRKCLNCGEQFVPQYPAQVTCSKECRNKRKNRLSSEYKQKRIENLQETVENLQETIEWLNCKLESALCGCKVKVREKKAEEKIVEPNNSCHSEVEQIEKSKPQYEPKPVKKIEGEPEIIPKPVVTFTPKKPKRYKHICTNCGISFRSVHEHDSYCSRQCEEEAVYGRI